MKNHAIKAIAEIDRNLSLLRESWMDAPAAKKSSWMGMIDQALDARLEHMAARDAEPIPA